RPLSSQLRMRLLGTRASGPVILTVGSLVERKGQDMIIRALPLIANAVPGVSYLIVGDGPYKANLKTLVTSMGLQDRVVFTGRVSDEELPEFYALSDVFAMPSRACLDSNDVEGFGMVFLEAGATGKPVVAGRSGGIEDAVVDGVTGLLVD